MKSGEHSTTEVVPSKTVTIDEAVQLLKTVRWTLATNKQHPSTVSAIEEFLVRAVDAIPQTTVIRPVETSTRQPDGYAYRRHSLWPGGESYIAFDSGGQVNGSNPIEAVPYWLGPAIPTEFPKSATDCDHANAIFKCAGCGIDLLGENRGHPERSAVEPTTNQDGQQTPAPSGHAGLGTTGQSPSAVRSSVKASEPSCGCATVTNGIGGMSKIWCGKHWSERSSENGG